MMRIAVTGASGLIGSAVCRRLSSESAELLRVTRDRAAKSDTVSWDPLTGDTDVSKWEGLDAVIHLAGENISKGRWTQAKKERIYQSRVAGTNSLCRMLLSLERPPRTLIAASAIGYYGDRGDEELDESSAAGSGFLSEVCQAWEDASRPAEESGMRVVRLRIGVVLAREGGALAAMRRPFQFGLGGRVGSGRQYWSWIAIDDLAQVVWTAVTCDELTGPVNAVAPHPVTNADFTRDLARVLCRPALFPLPAIAVRALMGEMGEELLLSSTRVIPRKLMTLGFDYSYPVLEKALRVMLKRKQRRDDLR